jgi:xanthine dehydrogenase large subunit
VDLASPATPEAVYWAIEQARRGATHGHLDEGGPGVEPEQPDPAAPPVRPYSERMQHVPVRA